MNKKMLLLILLLTILYVIYTILAYYGSIRGWMLNFLPLNFYVEKYKTKPKYKDRVVVFIEDSHYNDSFIKSILDQDVPVNEIVYVGNSGVSGRYKKIISENTIEKDYNGLHPMNMNVKRAGKNLLIYSILREPDKNTKIILIENVNKVYPADFISNLLEKSEMNPNDIIKGPYGSKLIKSDFYKENDLN